MNTMSGSMRPRRTGVALAGLLALGLSATPATAGSDTTIKSAGTRTTRTATETDGGINPTNVAIVETDLTAARCVTLPPEQQMHAVEANAYATGAGVTVAVLDGGFNLSHPDLLGHIASGGRDMLDNDKNPNDLGNGIDDDQDGVVDRCVGHGTFISGMVLKVAPGAKILPVRVRNDEGHGSDRSVADGIAYAISMKAKVINLSLEIEDVRRVDVRCQLNNALRQGVSVVVSAGNDALNELTSLADVSGGIAVGAVDPADRLAAFSNFVDAPPSSLAARFVLAPGVDLFGPIGSPTADARGIWSGTSFSSGLVSGAVAVVRQARPSLWPTQVADLLVRTCDPATDRFGAPLSYAGRVNVLRAVTE